MFQNLLSYVASMTLWLKSNDVTQNLKHQAINLNKIQISLLLGITCILLYILDIIATMVFLSVGLFYPLIKTYDALKKFNQDCQSSNKEAIEKSIIYWLFIAFFIIVETLAWPILKLLPLYQIIKILFIFWAVLPQTDGATIIYHKIIKPWLELETYNFSNIENIINNFVRFN